MSRQIKYSGGFTLIELVVALAIIAVMTTMAVPAWNEMITNQRLRTVTQDFYATLVLARSEAIKLRYPVRIVAHTNGWADGWVIVTDSNSNPADGITYKTYAQCVTNPAGCLRLTEAKAVAFTAAPVTTITYQRDGRSDAPNGTVFSVCDEQNRATKRNISIGLNGLPIIALGGACS